MKRYLFLTAVAWAATLSSQGLPPGQIPQSVQSAFEKMYGEGKKVTWNERHQGFYEADFLLDGKTTSAIFNANGLLMQSKVVVPKNKIPQEVISHAQKLFPNYTITEFGKISTPDEKTIYELEIEFKGDRKSLVYDSNNIYKGEKHFKDDDPLKSSKKN